jgi:hypothetical protein
MKKIILIISSLLILLSCRQEGQLNVEKRSGELREYKGKPTLFINETPVDPTIYGLTTCPGGRWSWDEMPQYSISRFSKEAGFNLFQGELWMRDIFPNNDHELDLALVRRQIRGFLEANPDAAVFIRLRCNASPEWNLTNREECCAWADTQAMYLEEDGLHRWDDHDTENPLRNSLASKKWRDDMVEKIKILCRELADTPEGNAVVGIQMATGIYGENHYWGFLHYEPDVSKPMQEHFRQWLKNKYNDNEALQQAWNDENITFETARVPNMKERYPDDMDGIFRNPNTNRQMIDYNQCQHELVVDNVLLFCKTAKEKWPRPLITGAFYGYTFYCFGRHAAGGHLAMERMLKSPYIDYLSAPMTYGIYAKEIGGTGHARGIVEACSNHGKIWLDEYDNSSSLHPKNMKEYLSDFTDNFEEDKAMIRRNMASTYCRGGGRWFYDFGPRTIGGWWNDSVLLEDIGKVKNVFEQYSQKPFEHEADILAVYDTEVFYYLAHNWLIDVISHTGVEWATADLFKSGVSFDMCYLFDLDKMDLDKYKAILFVNTFILTDEQRQFIKNKVAANGRTLIWNYMPGYCNGEELHGDFVKGLVAMDIKRVQLERKPPLIEMIRDKTQNFGVIGDYKPYFDFEKTLPSYSIWNNEPPVYVVTDPDAIKIARYRDDNHTAIAWKNNDDWNSVFCSLPLQKSGIMREIFRKAGCHVYTDSGDVLHLGGGILVVHTKEGGERTISLRNGKKIDVTLPAKSTMIMDIETGDILL